MSGYSGALTKCVVKRPAVNSAWGTVAATPTNQIPFVSEGLTNPVTMDKTDALEGTAATVDADVVAENPGGTLTTELWYEGLEYLFYAAMGYLCPTVYTGAHGSGSGGSPAPWRGTTVLLAGAYQHLFELDDTLHRSPWASGERAISSGSAGDATYWVAGDQKVRCVDVGIAKGVPAGEAWRYINAMVRSMTIRASLEGVTVEWDLTPYKNDTDAMNLTNWALPTSKVKAMFPHMRVGLSAAGASAPTEIGVKEITLTLTNPLDEVFESGANSRYKSEPMRSGRREVKGTVKLARYTADTFPAALRAGTDLQLSLKFQAPDVMMSTDGTPVSTGWYPTVQFICPLVRIATANFPVSGTGIIEGSLEFEAFPAAAPTWVTTLAGGMTMVKASELYLVIRNSRQYCWSRDNQATGVGALP